MERGKAGLYLLALGIVVVLVFATADIVGIGADPRFGPKQITGCLAGLILAGVGSFLYFGRR
jgi:hypothetical protein